MGYFRDYFWDHFGTTSGTTLGLLSRLIWDDSGYYFWCHFEQFSRLLWDYFGIHCGPFWSPFWSPFWIILEPILAMRKQQYSAGNEQLFKNDRGTPWISRFRPYSGKWQESSLQNDQFWRLLWQSSLETTFPKVAYFRKVVSRLLYKK